MDFAPPPYSLTDEYSSQDGTSIATATTTASTSQSSAGRTPPTLHPETTAGRPLPSTSSSADEVIFTPPYSPALSSYATDHDHLLSSSAAAYFESRPATIRNTAPPTIYRLKITPDTQPQDLPFPESFRVHGVLVEDWLTFLNFLCSDFIYNASREPTDRKAKGVQREGNHQPENIIAEWNEGFFKPRGLQITTIDVDEEIAVGQAADVTEASKEVTPRVPGAWIPHDHIPYDHEILGQSSAGRRRGFFGGFKPFQGSQQGGFRMGPIVADNDGFRMGSMIVADQNGFRLGGKSFMRREATDNERGRALGSAGHHKKTNRSSSVSSTSTSASGSSVDSESSVGSLPEYDDLREEELPLAKQSLLNWLSQSDRPLTKLTVQQIRHEIQTASNAPSQNTEYDMAQLRREVKDLMKEFRESKKKQKRDQRQARRERRAMKRAQKTERRAAKREARRLKREGKGKMVKRPPWMTSKSTVELEQPPPMPPRPTPEFTRAASVPSIRDIPFGGSSTTLDPVPGMTTQLHCTWPYTRNAPYSPGNASPSPRLPGTFPNTFADSSEQLYAQAKEMERIARSKEEMAIELRTEATGRNCGEKDRLKKFDKASALEEEAEKCILEADRLRAEALHLDGELARELEESNGRGHTAGVTEY